MKIKIKSKLLRYLGSEVEEGDVIEVDDQTAKVWIQNGRAELDKTKSTTSSNQNSKEKENIQKEEPVKEPLKNGKEPQVKADKKTSQER